MKRAAVTRGMQVAVKTVLGILDVVGILLVFNLWWLRLSGRLAGEVDAPEIVLLYALATAVVAAFGLLIAGIAVMAKSIAAWWLATPLLILVAAFVGVCAVAGDL